MRQVMFRMVPAAALFLASGGLPFSSGQCLAQGQVYRLAELNTEQIRALNRQTTVVIIPGGVLEEHGPYLLHTRMAMLRAPDHGPRRLSLPGRDGRLLSSSHPRSGRANDRANFSFRLSRSPPRGLRAIFMDLATSSANGLRWFCVARPRWSPNRVLMKPATTSAIPTVTWCASWGPSGAGTRRQAEVPSAARAEDGLRCTLAAEPVIMALRPDLVPRDRAGAIHHRGDSSDLQRIAPVRWPGLLRCPRHASAAGTTLDEAEHRVRPSLRILGADERQVRSPSSEVRIQGPHPCGARPRFVTR
jgi:hypothetical protein